MCDGGEKTLQIPEYRYNPVFRLELQRETAQFGTFLRLKGVSEWRRYLCVAVYPRDGFVTDPTFLVASLFLLVSIPSTWTSRLSLAEQDARHQFYMSWRMLW